MVGLLRPLIITAAASGRGDSNPRPPAPKAGALPGCATPRSDRRAGRGSDIKPVIEARGRGRYTRPPVKASVEPLEGNKVKLSVEVEEAEFDKAVEAAFRRIAREVRIPGFRPGKAPRRLLEARLGTDAARQEALREGVPDWYVAALREHDVDAIASPEIDITSGETEGPVAFDAVVEVRPQVSVA